MPRVEPQNVRQQQIIDAAISVIHEQGICNLRIADVAKRAKVSNGLVFHHFETRDGVLLASMRYIMRSYSAEARMALAGKTDPRERILALVHMAYRQRQLYPKIASAWLALFYLGKTHADFSRLLSIYQQRQFSNLRADTRRLFGNEQADFYATALQGIVDGIWLKYATQRDEPDYEAVQREAVRIAAHILDGADN